MKPNNKNHSCAPDKMAVEEIGKLVRAGDILAEAAHRIQAQHDGVHRLRLALSNWYKVRADEFGRGKP